MRLIGLAVVLAVSLALTPFAAEAQQAAKVPRIGYLRPSNATSTLDRFVTFRQALRELGYVEGTTILVEVRSADGRAD